jgi:hypothetical protein
MFVLDLPRLSVDIDLNYVGAIDREGMLADRPKIEQAVRAVCARQGLTVRRTPGEHAGGKWRLGYERAAGGTGALELDLNFLQRQPLWEAARRDSLALGARIARGIVVIEEHELCAGKLAALFGRDASRDLFDVHALLSRGTLDPRKLRLAFLVYGACSRRDWRTLSVEDVRMDPRDAEQRLVPLLRADLAPARPQLDAWSARLVVECRTLVSSLLQFEDAESEFLAGVNDRGEVVPELLTDDAALRERIRLHPGLAWKALNVRRHRGLEPTGRPGAAPPEDADEG